MIQYNYANECTIECQQNLENFEIKVNKIIDTLPNFIIKHYWELQSNTIYKVMAITDATKLIIGKILKFKYYFFPKIY